MKPKLKYCFFFFISIAFRDVYVLDSYKYTRFAKYVKEKVSPMCQSAIESKSDSTSEWTSEETSEWASELISEWTSEETSESTSEETSHSTSDWTSIEISEWTSEWTRKEISVWTRESKSKEISELTNESTSKEISELTSESTSKEISEWTRISISGLARESSPFGRLRNRSKSTKETTNQPTRIQEEKKLKYILQWTPSNHWLFSNMRVGQQSFIDRKCPHINCFVTSNRKLLGDYTKFDVIAFSGEIVRKYKQFRLPQKRSPHQKYVFATMESSRYYPVTRAYFDNFFNWTWTYKLDSDTRCGYVVVRDVNDKIIGPNKIMHWMKHEDMLPVSKELLNILRRKTKTVAWFVSHCSTKSKRENYVKKLNEALQSGYNLRVDIYGICGELDCNEGCEEMVQRDYLFYLSFENSFSEDYVTEKLVRALAYNAIPIVYGGANYSRFLSEGSYINARDFKEEMLAAKIYELADDFEQYVEYFRWTNHYEYHYEDERTETDDLCEMCALLNDDSKLKTISMYKEFRKWWNT